MRCSASYILRSRRAVKTASRVAGRSSGNRMAAPFSFSRWLCCVESVEQRAFQISVSPEPCFASERLPNVLSCEFFECVQRLETRVFRIRIQYHQVFVDEELRTAAVRLECV